LDSKAKASLAIQQKRKKGSSLLGPFLLNVSLFSMAAAYRSAANFLNFSNVDLVCLQHEYGSYGGNTGSHILELLRYFTKPVENASANLLLSA
jgi:hypothetical protein